MSSSIAFSQENQTVSTVVEKSFFDSVSSTYHSVSARQLTCIQRTRRSQVVYDIYNVGATLSKGDFSLSGNYYLFREEGYIPQENNFLDLEIWLSYAAFNKYGLNLCLGGRLLSDTHCQDDFIDIYQTCHTDTSLRATKPIFISELRYSDFDREIDYTNEQEDLVVTKNSPAYHIIVST